VVGKIRIAAMTCIRNTAPSICREENGN